MRWWGRRKNEPHPTAAPTVAPLEPGAQLGDVVLAAIEHLVELEEQPDSVPRELQPHRERVEAAFQEVARDHPDRRYVPRTLVAATPLGDADWRTWGHAMDLFDLLCALVAGGRLDEHDVDRIAALAPGWTDLSGLRRQLVAVAAGESRWEDAERLTGGFAEEDAFVGWREIGHAAAVRGDRDRFLRHWKQYAAGKHRDAMATLKDELVAGVAREHGLEAAAALCRDRRFGDARLPAAFAALPEASDPDALHRVLHAPPADRLAEVDRLDLELAAILAVSPRDPEHDHPRLGDVVDRIVALDPTVSKEQMRIRDALLLSTWPAIGEQATLRRVRAAARTPWIRSELTALPRDVG